MAAFIDRLSFYCRSVWIARLIILNTASFLLVWIIIISGNALGISGNFSIPWLCVPSLFPALLSRPWTILTYMVTQYDFLHLLFNIIWLFWFGSLLPVYIPDRSKLYIYIGGGLAGALTYIAVNAFPHSIHSSSYLCGASAAVLAIMSAAVTFSPEKRISFFLIGNIKLVWVGCFCIILTFLGSAGATPGALGAHIAGVMAGFCFAFCKRLHTVTTVNRCNLKFKIKAPIIKAADRNPVGRHSSEYFQNLQESRLREELDIILDKIRTSGYDSLSSDEKSDLNTISRILDKY